MTAADYAARLMAEQLAVLERLIAAAEAAMPHKEPTP